MRPADGRTRRRLKARTVSGSPAGTALAAARAKAPGSVAAAAPVSEIVYVPVSVPLPEKPVIGDAPPGPAGPTTAVSAAGLVT